MAPPRARCAASRRPPPAASRSWCRFTTKRLRSGVCTAQLIDVARTLAAKYSLTCEVIYVDDGSSDDSLAVADRLPAIAIDVQVVSLSRNFGKEAALLAGLDHARLGAVLFIDGDGQHPPAMIDTLVGHWLDDGYDVVYTAKAHRAERIGDAPPVGEGILPAHQLGRAHENPRRRRRFPAAVAARRRCFAPPPRAQSLLQGPVELDRLSPDPHRLSSRRRAPTAAPPGMCARWSACRSTV